MPTEPPEPMMQFFSFAHLPPRLQDVSKPFCELASLIATTLPRNPERTVALRKLLEAKDCAVRALLFRGEHELLRDAMKNLPDPPPSGPGYPPVPGTRFA